MASTYARLPVHLGDDTPNPAGETLGQNPLDAGAWIAVLIICIATLIGAWLARRNAERIGLWLSIASAVMLVTAVTDIVPDVLRGSLATGLPLWAPGLSAAVGFLVVSYFTRKGCGHGHEHAFAQRPGRHAPGRHRRVKQAVGAIAFGGMGTAAALSTHRVVEGATLALIVSLPIILALTIHSASEGLALTAMLGEARERLSPWLVTSAVSPAVGVVVATVRPLPMTVVPMLLALVGGVLLRTAIVGRRLAASKRRSGELRRRHMAISIAAASAIGTLMVMAH
ncbi:ZIP family metal transporter [Streptomyces formicae]|uniref:Integral membrane protein n=1 Tax=Streptomyces formicae TaxID=1616117 RepID=A0ABY3WMX1_9ACTN|nr:ZIP family metal transporter [Streptomyces formicae]UNM12132.1 hypothetical protein J4032_11800 [Streptomyces formicae]